MNVQKDKGGKPMTKIWQEITKAPTTADKYYLAKDKGGYNAFTGKYNMFNANGNCTSFAWGRFCQVGSISAKGIIQKTCKLPLCNAEDWFSSCTAYEKGQTPRRGAVACWSKGKKWNSKDGAGHVAIVENFDSNYIYTSESGYNHYLFRRCKYPIRNGKPYISGYTFEGFIYNPWEENNYKVVSESFKVTVTATNGLNVRKGSGTVYGVVKVLPYKSVVTVYDTKGNWGRIGVNQWVCLDYTKRS